MKLDFFVRWLLGIALFSLALTSSWQSIAHADSIVVNTLEDENDHSCDDGDCSLRDAIELAANGDVITFTVTGTIMVQGDLTLEKNISISGPGATNLTLTGDNYTVVFLISSQATVSISGITIARSVSGIINSGQVTITDSSFEDNGSVADGAALRNSGVATVSNSTFARNAAYFGVGGAIANTGTLDVSNSTFFRNTANYKHGYGGAIASQGKLTVTNSTFSENSAYLGGDQIAGSATIKNTILANGRYSNSCSVGMTDGGGNLRFPRTDASCVGAYGDPKLGPLADNGGATQTLALGANSAALEHGVSGNCPATDQRGQPRPNPSDSACDAGAYESELRPTEIRWEDDDPHVLYDSWQGKSNPNARASYRISNQKDDTVTFNFTQGVAWITQTGPDMGIAHVTIDGVNKGFIDLYTPTKQWRVSKYFGKLKSPPHKIVIQVTGNKNPQATDANIVVDAFKADHHTIEDTAFNVRYNTWRGNQDPSASGGSYRFSGTAGALVRFKFTGEQIEWITATGPAYGKAAVYLDGIKQGTYDLYSPTQQFQVAIPFSGLPLGKHTIEIRARGTKNAASSDNKVIVDAFRMPISPP